MTLSSVSGRSVVSGKVKGDILFSSEAISFLGGVNPKTGIVIARNHSLEGKSISPYLDIISLIFGFWNFSIYLSKCLSEI